jgi:hypothetical protein
VSETPADFREALGELIDTTAPEPAGHPSDEQWIAYQRGELSAADEARLAEHLVRCRDCFDLAQAADALFGAGSEVRNEREESAELASAAVWRLLRPELAEAPKSPARRDRRSAFRRRFPAALAAALCLAVLGLTAWNLAQRSALSALRAPKPNALIVDLPDGERATDETKLTAGSGPWTLVFHRTDELPAYRLAIRDAGTGSEIYSYLLRPNADLALTLQFPEGLPPGRYRLELSGGPGTVLSTRSLRVVAPGRGG